MTDLETRMADVLFLAAKMREAQDDFYRTKPPRPQNLLIRAKQAETAFDNAIGPLLAEIRERGWSAPIL
jgi:hypothetical protein